MKKILAIFLSITMILGLVSCTPESKNTVDKTEEPKDKELVVAEAGEWLGVDSMQLDTTYPAYCLIADPIIEIGKNGEMLPCIASAVDISEDGKTIRFTFSDDLKFANGNSLTPEDVVASIERFREISPYNSELENVEKVEIDGQDVVVTLSKYTSTLATTFSGTFLPIYDTEELDSKSKDVMLWDCMPYGQYYVKEYVSGSHLTLACNENYKTFKPFVKNKGVGAFDKVTCRFVEEEFSRVTSLNVGDSDIAISLSADGVKQITDKNIVVNSYPVSQIYYIEINQSNEILSDINVRKALALATNREEIIKIANDKGQLEYSICCKETFNHPAEFAKYYKENYCDDMDQAKKLLEEAGWKDTDGNGYLDKDGKEFALGIVASNAESDEAITQSLQIQFKEIGVKLDIELLESGYRYEKIGNGEYDLGVESFGGSDPITILRWLMMNTGNLKKYEEMVAVLDEALGTIDSEKRTELVGKAEKFYADEAVIIPLYSNNIIVANAGDITGFMLNNIGTMTWNDVERK